MNNLPIMKKSLAYSMTILLTLGIMLSIIGPAMAQEDSVAPGINVPATSSQAPGPTDPAELETFLDELLGKQMEEYHIAGAAVSVVKDGKLFLAKGYGFADLDNGIPVDPERTMFRIGSVGKTFTWTAVMQLAEQGKLDLDADINTYLDFRIPDTFPQPVTLKHLITHTSGFEERWVGSIAFAASDLVPAREWLVAHMAARVRTPGEGAAYSNYNSMLAGYIVERVSGQPYAQYIQENILDPLGMVNSTVYSPLPADMRPFASLGYTYVDGAFQVSPEYYPQPALLPSGMHWASVTDIARYMIAHLQDGRYSDANIAEARILEESTIQQMHSTGYTPDPRFLGLTYGFFDHSHNGQRTIGHRGYSTPMNGLLELLPDQNLGVYVVYNSAGGGFVADPHVGFQAAFYDHYFPAPPASTEPLQPPADFAERAGRFVGSYRMTSFPYTSFLTVAAVFGQFTEVVSDPGDGTLLVTLNGLELSFVEVEPLYFRQVDGPYSIVFREDAQGRITSMSVDPINYTAYEKLDWYQTSNFNITLLMVCVLVFLSMLPAAVIGFFWNRRHSSVRASAPRAASVAFWLLLGIGGLNLLILAGTAWGATGGMTSELLDPPLIIKIALGLSVLSAALTTGALIYTVLAWKNRYGGLASRSYYTLVTIAAVAFVWFLNYWNLLGWRY